MDNFRKKIDESIADLFTDPLIKRFFSGVKKEVPGVEKDVEDFHTSFQNMLQKYDSFCDKYPNSPLCSEKYKKLVKGKITGN